MNHINGNTSFSFPCDKCGLCCQNIGSIDELNFLNRGDGVCKHFDAHNLLCTIYENRPLICKVDEGYSLFQGRFTKNEYYQLNLQACEKLKNLHISIRNI